MEKQPVDDLFARKLRSHEVNVNPDAFARLQQRMGVKEIPRRKVNPFWRYTAAACFLGILAVGYVVGTKNTAITSSQNKVVRYAEKASKRVGKIPEAERLAANLTEKKTGRETSIVHSAATRYVRPYRSASAAKENEMVTSISPLSSEQVKQVAIIETVQPQAIVPVSPTSISARQVIQATPIQKAVTDRTIILTITEPPFTAEHTDKNASGNLDDARPHGFSGLLGKLRQLKNGETFARATIGTGKTTTPLGRTLTELKESLKNETTIDQ